MQTGDVGSEPDNLTPCLGEALCAKRVTMWFCIATSRCSLLATHQDAFSLSEAGYQSIGCQQEPPVCARFARLDWGYEAFSLSEAGKRVKNSETGKRVKNSETDSPYRVAKRSHL